MLMFFLCLVCTVAASEPAAHESDEAEAGGPSVFSGYYGEAIWTLAAFVLLVVVLKIIAWKPLLANIQSREEYIARQISEAEKIKHKADEILVQYQEKLAGSEGEGKKIIASHTSKAEKEALQIVEKAKSDTEVLKAKAKLDIERNRVEAISDLWLEAGDMVLKLGKEVLGRNLTVDDNRKLIGEAIDKLKTDETEV